MVRDSRQTTLRPLRYCVECNIFRPPTRCSHCYICKGCVIGFDHHCVWLGTCIGARNYLDFMLFLLSITSLIILSEYCLFKEIIEVNSTQDISLNLALRERLHVSLAIPFCFVFLLMIGLLLSFHFVLICKNVTTHEYLRGIYKFGDLNSNSKKYKIPQNSTINPFNFHHTVLAHLHAIVTRMSKSRHLPSQMVKAKRSERRQPLNFKGKVRVSASPVKYYMQGQAKVHNTISEDPLP